MTQTRRQSVRAQLLFSFGMLCTVLLVIGGMLFFSLRFVERNNRLQQTRALDKLSSIDGTAQEVGQIQAGVLRQVLASDKGQIAVLDHAVRDGAETNVAEFADYEEFADTKEEKLLYDRIVQARKTYWEQTQRVLALGMANQDAEARGFINSTQAPAYDEFLKAVSALMRYVRIDAGETIRATARSISNINIIGDVLVVTAILIVIGTGFDIAVVGRRLNEDNELLQTEIKERKQAEECFAGAFEYAAIGMGLALPDGRWLKVNRALCDLVGYTEAELLGRTFRDITLPEDLERDLAGVGRLLAGEARSYETEKRYLHARGHLVTVLLNVSLVHDGRGQPLYVISQMQNITRRKQVEAARDQLVAMLESTTDLVSIADPTGRLLYLNGAGRDLLGVDLSEDITRTTLGDFIPDPASHPLLTEGLSAAAHDGIWSGEVALLSRGGREFQVSQVIVAHRSSDGAVESYSTIMRDITQRERAKQELSRLNAELEQRVAERTEDLFAATQEAERANRAKSEFLSRTSHELRTPLNAILGFAQLLEMEGRAAEDADNIDQILKAGRHLLDLVNEVLDISGLEAGKVEIDIRPLEVTEVIDEALMTVRLLAAGRDVTLDALVCESRVLADRQRFKQVITYLLFNAIQYNRRGGRVTLVAEEIGGFLRLSVTDTGPGIAEADIGKIFNAFERLGGAGKVDGIGLGLTISRRLIEMMGGRIGVESVPREGSTFWIEAPLAKNLVERPGQARLPAVTNPKSDPLNPRTVLYIEDSLANLRLITRILARRPAIQVLSARTIEFGLEIAREHRPDLILLDPRHPDCHGDQLLAALLADPRTSEIPVVMLSSEDLPGTRGQMLAAGARAVVGKPVEVRTLLRILDQVLGFRPGRTG